MTAFQLPMERDRMLVGLNPALSEPEKQAQIQQLEAANAVPVGGLPAEPPPVLVPPDTGSPQPPTLPDMAQNMAPPMPAGANIGGLDALGRQIGNIGASMASGGTYDGQIEEAGKRRASAVRETGQIQQSRARAEAGNYDQQIEALTAHQQNLERIRRGEEKAVGQARAEYNEELADARHAGISRERRKELEKLRASGTVQQQAAAQAELEKAQNIDPDQFLGSAGRKIGAAIAMALGAYGSALSGGPNSAMEIIQQSIRDNIDAQKANRASRERSAERARERVGETQEQFQTEEERANRAYGVGIEMAKVKLARISAGLQGTEAGLRAEELASGLEQESAVAANTVEQQRRAAHLDALQAQAGVATNAAQLREGRRARAEEARGGPGLQVPGLQGVGISKEAMNESAQMLGDGQAMLRQLAELRDFVGGEDGVGHEMFPTASAARAQAMSSNLMLDYGKNLLKLGVLSAPDMEILTQIIPEDPTQFRQEVVSEKLKNAETYVRTKMATYLQSRGYSLPEDREASTERRPGR
jgi:hypothetical protein